MKGQANILLEKHLRELKLGWSNEYRFHDQRKWRFDYVLYEWPDETERPSALRIAVEIEGSVWTQGRHTRGKGFQQDMVKYNTATMMGWRVLRFSTEDVLRGRARAFLKEHLCK